MDLIQYVEALASAHNFNSCFLAWQPFSQQHATSSSVSSGLGVQSDRLLTQEPWPARQVEAFIGRELQGAERLVSWSGQGERNAALEVEPQIDLIAFLPNDDCFALFYNVFHVTIVFQRV